MKSYLLIILSILIFTHFNASAQNSQIKINTNNLSDIQILRNKILSSKLDSKKIIFNTLSAKSHKSPALALIFSFILPGAGHFYINRMDVGKYFLGIDLASWVGLASLNIYGDALRDDSRVFSVQHGSVAGLNDKPDDFFLNIGNYNNVYDYNNDKLIRGEYSLLYNVNTFYWNWDSPDSRGLYETQRKSSERVYNSRVIFGSLLIVNRIVSGISAYLLAGKENKKTTSLHIEPQLMYKSDYSFDGVKINLSKNF